MTRPVEAGRGRVVEARDVHLSFGPTPALRGAQVAVAAGRDPGRHGAERYRASPPCCTAWPGSWSPIRVRSGSPGARVDTLGEEARSKLRRDHFGFVFQFGQLVPELTAEENVALPLLLGGVRRREALVRARDWLARLDLDWPRAPPVR